jgi:hypothetical protein
MRRRVHRQDECKSAESFACGKNGSSDALNKQGQ